MADRQFNDIEASSKEDFCRLLDGMRCSSDYRLPSAVDVGDDDIVVDRLENLLYFILVSIIRSKYRWGSFGYSFGIFRSVVKL